MEREILNESEKSILRKLRIFLRCAEDAVTAYLEENDEREPKTWEQLAPGLMKESVEYLRKGIEAGLVTGHYHNGKLRLYAPNYLFENYMNEEKSEIERCASMLTGRNVRVEVILRKLKREETKNELVKLEDADLSVRSFNVLRNAGFSTLNEVVLGVDTMEQMLRIRHIGKACASEIIGKAHSFGMLMKWEMESEDNA